MKKIIAILLSLVLTVSLLFGCIAEGTTAMTPAVENTAENETTENETTAAEIIVIGENADPNPVEILWDGCSVFQATTVDSEILEIDGGYVTIEDFLVRAFAPTKEVIVESDRPLLLGEAQIVADDLGYERVLFAPFGVHEVHVRTTFPLYCYSSLYQPSELLCSLVDYIEVIVDNHFDVTLAPYGEEVNQVYGDIEVVERINDFDEIVITIEGEHQGQLELATVSGGEYERWLIVF